MPPARDLHRVRRARPPDRLLPVLRPGRLAHRVGKRFEIVTTGAGGGRRIGEPDDFPAPGRGEPLAVFGAEVVAMGLGIGGERAEDRGRVGIDVRQCRDGGTAARGSRTATYRAHDVGRYRTLERAATTLPHLTPTCRPWARVTDGSDVPLPTCAAAGASRCARASPRSPGRTYAVIRRMAGGRTKGRIRSQPWPECSSADIRPSSGPEPGRAPGVASAGHPAGPCGSRDRRGHRRVTLRR